MRGPGNEKGRSARSAQETTAAESLTPDARAVNTAAEINRLHSELCGLARTSLEKAIRIGELLTEQKAKLKHGEWLPWVKENLEFSRQTADNYQRLFRNREKLLTVGNLDLTDAYRLLSAPADEVDEEPPRVKTATEELAPEETSPATQEAPAEDDGLVQLQTDWQRARPGARWAFLKWVNHKRQRFVFPARKPGKGDR